MSASPAGNGPSTATPNGTTVPRKTAPRRRQKANPLVQRSHKPATPAKVPVRPNGAPKQRPPQRPSQPPPAAAPTISDPDYDEPPADAAAYPLITTKKEVLESLRYHVMRFSSKKPVDPRDHESFTPPVRLHRRDPAAPPSGVATVETEEQVKKEGEDSKERERLEAQKEERRRQREEMQKMIAPSTKKQKQKQNLFQKKTEQVYNTYVTPEAQKRSQLRYEEALPWHLEDFDNKNTYVGSYEAALSETYMAMVVEGNNFRMIPLEKWYKFSAKNKFSNLTADQAEQMMTRKVKESRWILDKQKQEAMKKKDEGLLAKPRLYTRSGKEELPSTKKIKNEDSMPSWDAGEQADADMLDFDLNEEFQDDDQDPLFEGDVEETKEAEERIAREQRGANVFQQNEEAEVDREEEIEQLQKSLRKMEGKATRKALQKREKNFDYDASDSDDNPYVSSSESEDSEDEAQRAEAENRKREEERKQLEEQQAEKNAAGKNGEKPSSGASSKGTNTPSGRPSKHPGPGQKPQHVSAVNLKRPGSPNLSEASGNESSRNKKKIKHGDPTKLLKKSVPVGAGSDSEATDGGTKKRHMKLSSKASSPTDSRAGSPSGGSMIFGASRAGSPSTPAGRQPAEPVTGPFPTPAEIRDAVPPTGMRTKTLITMFKKRVPANRTTEFTKMVKNTLRYDKPTELMFRK